MSKNILMSIALAFFSCAAISAQNVMSEEYCRVWDSLRPTIEDNIEKYRKADGEIVLKNVKPGTEVTIEQVSHDFIFGSNIFLYDHFDSAEKNEKYLAPFGPMFNSATLAFYWKKLEIEKDKPRYAADSPFEYRRPATDPVVDFCESRGIHMKGHALIYGIRSWGHPEWMSEDREVMEKEFEAHIKEIGKRYKGRIHNWDVVNECLDQANRGIMPDDYTYKSYRWAMKYFPKNVTFNTNECNLRYDITKIRRYVEIVRDLTDRGAKVDYMGVQMHIFKPYATRDIAAGKFGIYSPTEFYDKLYVMSEAERPIFVSEVTISVPTDSDSDRDIQMNVAKDYYRLWFSHPSVVGITWWNLADGGAVAGEPSYSGLFDADMNPKPSYYALEHLINHEWKTNLSVPAPTDGLVKFRGFKGGYKITYTDKKGDKVVLDYTL